MMLRNCPGARRLSGSFFRNLLLIVLGFLFGEILLFLIMFLEDDPGSWFCMGTVIALVMLLVTTVLFYGVGYTGAFSLALSMNCTRRRFLLKIYKFAANSSENVRVQHSLVTVRWIRNKVLRTLTVRDFSAPSACAP